MTFSYPFFIKSLLTGVLFISYSVGVSAQSSLTYNDYQSKKNMAAFGLSYDHYDEENLEAWQKMFLEYRRYTGIGPIITRLNVGHRFDITDYQGEIDFWPEFNQNWYGYFNLGYSDGDLFPELRLGAEIFRALPKGFEASLGLRYLKFSEDDVVIFTGSVSKYLGKWLFIGRPYFAPKDSGLSTSFTIMARRYLGNPDTFSTLMAGFGFSPDERRFLDGQSDERILKSRFIGLRTDHLVSNRYELFGEIKSTWQEFLFSDDFIRILTFEMGARYRF